ncbi:hypothetical protein [Prosthecomicrobium pneumaticum]|uniref:Uncharacterized protein n=1 Tax=Prosthecomicrobium pneumaticum TaxID=81895 RepID=A0A7W9L1N0_9HYPH|nr:hypothetical protein [Prosthecomicrobium pneumaticum]MBB5752857.1 hypothetical protein [Prosthecomicrobium pneumaticum]
MTDVAAAAAEATEEGKAARLDRKIEQLTHRISQAEAVGDTAEEMEELRQVIAERGRTYVPISVQKRRRAS